MRDECAAKFRGELFAFIPPRPFILCTRQPREDATVSPRTRTLMHFVEYLGLARVGSTFMSHPRLVFSYISITGPGNDTYTWFGPALAYLFWLNL